MLGLGVFLLIVATIVSVMWDLKLFQRLWKWLKYVEGPKT